MPPYKYLNPDGSDPNPVHGAALCAEEMYKARKAVVDSTAENREDAVIKCQAAIYDYEQRNKKLAEHKNMMLMRRLEEIEKKELIDASDKIIQEYIDAENIQEILDILEESGGNIINAISYMNTYKNYKGYKDLQNIEKLCDTFVKELSRRLAALKLPIAR